MFYVFNCVSILGKFEFVLSVKSPKGGRGILQEENTTALPARWDCARQECPGKHQADRQIKLLAAFQADGRQSANPIPQYKGMMSHCLLPDSGGTSQSILLLLTKQSERNGPFEIL